MKAWGANLSSECKQRQLMVHDLKNLNVEAESIPFCFNTRKGVQELRPAPLAYVDDLKSLLFHLLNEKERYNLIPSAWLSQLYTKQFLLIDYHN